MKKVDFKNTRFPYFLKMKVSHFSKIMKRNHQITSVDNKKHYIHPGGKNQTSPVVL